MTKQIVPSIMTLDEAVTWLRTRSKNAHYSVSDLIEFGAQGSIPLQVAIPTKFLPDRAPGGLHTWPLTGIFDFSPISCRVLQAQRAVQMSRSTVNAGLEKIEVNFKFTVEVTTEMLRIRGACLEGFAPISTKGPPAAFAKAMEKLLTRFEERARANGMAINRRTIPGAKKYFYEFARRNKEFSALQSDSTFASYIKGLCKFKQHEQPVYETLFPELYGKE